MWGQTTAYNKILASGDLGTNAQAIPSQDGEYIVVAHGSPFSVAIGGPDGIQIGADQLAAIIEEDPSYAPHEDVLLISCYTGEVPPGGGAPFAQQLAQDLQAYVYAPDTEVWVYPSGSYVVAPTSPSNVLYPDLQHVQQMSTFTPVPIPIPKPGG
jgi:hypothetical protein